MNPLLLAWRNIWRNKRRTLITAGSLFSAIVFAIIMRSMQYGSYEIMIENGVRSYSGYLQVQQKDYWKDKTIDDLMLADKDLISRIEKTKGVLSSIPRLESFALATNGMKSKGVIFQGIDPEKESSVSNIVNNIVKGKMILPGDSGLLLASRLASYLNLSVGDSVILISQGYQGVSATGNYSIQGIVKFPSPLLDGRLIIGNLNIVQQFYGAENLLTSLVINIKDGDETEAIQRRIEPLIDTNNLKVISWLIMNKEIKQQIDSDNASGIIMLLILYTVIFFGVLGTIIMMTAERSKEFAVMVAIGMQRKRLQFIIFIESLYMGLIGIIAGIIVAFPITYYYYKNPIPLKGELAKIMEQYGLEPVMPFSIDVSIYLNQFLVVLVLLLIACIYPMIKIKNFKLIISLHK